MFKTFKTKILILVFCVMAAMVGPSAYFTLEYVSREMIKAEERSARNILDLAWLNIRSGYRDLQYYEEKAIEARKRETRHLMQVMFAYFDSFHGKAASGEITMEEARQKALECSLATRYGNSDYFFVYDLDLNAIGHPDPRIRGRNMTWYREKSGVFSVQVARNTVINSPENEGFELVNWARLKRGGEFPSGFGIEPGAGHSPAESPGDWEEVRKIIFVKLYPKWEWMVGTGVYIDDIDREVAAKRQEMLEALKAALENMQISRTGRVFVFNGKCEVVVCPSPMKEEALRLQNEEEGRRLLAELVSACGKKSGNLRYLWSDGSTGNIDEKTGKIAWVRYFEPLDWYIAAAVSIDEIEETAVKLIGDFLLLALVILAGGATVSFLVADRVSRPLNSLARIANDLVRRSFADLGETAAELGKIGGRSRDEVKILSDALTEMVSALRKHIHELRETTAAKERIESELRIARDIQMSMVPKDFSIFEAGGEVSLAAVLEPAKEVGGDLYDFFFLGDRKLCLLVGDVSGKGIPAALFMARSKALLRHTALRGPGLGPDEILGAVNRELVEGNDMMMFLTVILGILDMETGELTYSNAGHLHPLLLQGGGGCRTLDLPPGLALGISGRAEYSSISVRLLPGEGLFLFTDGVTEAADESNVLFEKARLERILADLPPSADVWSAIDRVLCEVKEFSRAVPQADDITALCLRFKGPGGGAP